MNKRSIVPLCVICLFCGFHARSQNNSHPFRVVGYYPLKNAMTADPASVLFNEVTHINLAFLNPDSAGNFSQDLSGLIPFIQAAHKNRVFVLPSIAGGGPHAYYHWLLKAQQRQAFIARLLNLVLQYDMDGIDVDLEGPDIDENYTAFVSELAKSFHAHHKLVTAAIAVFYKDALSDQALAQYDFMNVMSYDHTGPWDITKPGPHSTYDQAVADLDYFRVERKISKSRLVLGVGFYGYGFGPLANSPASDMNYGDIVKTFPNAADSDEVHMPGGAVLYYNGEETIRKKVLLAKTNASGIMIWQLLGDAPGQRSLLKTITETAKGK